MVVGDGLGRGIEVVQVGELVAQGVADEAVGFTDLLEPLLADHDVAAVVLRGDPQAHHVTTVVLDVALRRLRLLVTALTLLGLGDFLAVFVDHEAVGQHRLEGCGSIARQRQQQGRLEPAPMLIAAFQIHIGLPTAIGTPELGTAHEYRAAGRTGVDPDIEGVLALADGFRTRPVGRPASGPQRLDRSGEPHVGALSLDPVGGLADDARIEDGLAGRIVEGWDRHAPGALARDAPVGPGLHGALDAVLAPVGDPVHRINGRQCLLSEGQGSWRATGVVDADEPLVDGPEDDR